MRTSSTLVFALGLSLLSACTATVGTTPEGDNDEIINEFGDDGSSVAYLSSLTVGQAIYSSCTTSVVRGLSDQLIEELNCIRPNTLKSLNNLPSISLGSAVLPFMQTNAVDALKNVASGGPTMFVNSALRSLAQQFLLYRWYVEGYCRDVVSLAASPGTSRHESGIAVDISDHGSWISRMSNQNYAWFGNSDPVHFEYRGSSVALTGLSVLAFQRLWNRNNPNNKISEDGSYGPQTEGALRQAPAAGFPIGSSCAVQTSLRAIGFEWEKKVDGTYDFTASVPNEVTHVEYLVEGFLIGVGTREEANDFGINYRFNFEKEKRLVEVLGYNQDGNLIAKGVGLIDSLAGTSVYIRQLGANIYDVGVERPAADVTGVEVIADGFLIVDSTTGENPSPRFAARNFYNTLGTRNFVIKLYRADGTVQSTLTRTFVLQ